MTDDIVTRLRGSCHTRHIKGLPCTIVASQGCPPCEAADEIERLRADLENVRDMNEKLTEELQTYYSEDELNADWE